MRKRVILVDKEDNELGTEDKLKAHKEAKLHRAFSVFIFDNKKRLLLQKREGSKYHSGGLWTNTCCSHPKPGEKEEEGAKRRLEEEFGFTTELKKAFSFIYEHRFDNGLIENEFDHVFVGKFDGKVAPDPEEIEDYKWISLEELEKDVRDNPEEYTPWFKIIFDKHIHDLKNSITD